MKKPTYALLLVDQNEGPHMAVPDSGELLCGLEYASSTQHALLSHPTPTTCSGCARVAGIVEKLLQ